MNVVPFILMVGDAGALTVGVCVGDGVRKKKKKKGK